MLDNVSDPCDMTVATMVDARMDKLTVYQKPTCSTCRATLSLLREAKAPFVTIDYFATPLSVATLKNILKKLGMSPRDLLRTGEEIYKKINLDKKAVPAMDLTKFEQNYPAFIHQPTIDKRDQPI